MSNKTGTSKPTREKSRLAAVLELAEILNSDSGGSCQNSQESK